MFNVSMIDIVFISLIITWSIQGFFNNVSLSLSLKTFYLNCECERLVKILYNKQMHTKQGIKYNERNTTRPPPVSNKRSGVTKL